MKKAAPQYQQSSPSQGKYSTPQQAKESVWMKHDREFFQKNPRYSHHLRGLLPGELLHAQAHAPANHEIHPYTHVIIRQLAPGYRVRHFMQWPGLVSAPPHWETFFSLIWEAVASGRGGDTNTLKAQAREIDRVAAACAGVEVQQ